MHGHVGARLAAVVRDPLLAEHVPPEAVVEPLPRMALWIEERVRGCPQPDDGFARLDILQDALKLVVGQRAESREHHQQIRGRQRLEPFDVVLRLRFGPRVGDRGREAVRLLEDRGDHRHRDLGPVLVVARHEHDVWRARGRLRAAAHARGEREHDRRQRSAGLKPASRRAGLTACAHRLSFVIRPSSPAVPAHPSRRSSSANGRGTCRRRDTCLQRSAR